MIDARDLRRTFPGQASPALDGLTFSIGHGMVALAGRNGSGKTTLLDVLATLLMPTGGVVSVAGFDVATRTRDVRLRSGYAMTGARGLHQRLTGRANLEFFAALHPRAGDPGARVRELAERLDLGAFLDRQVRHCSDGMLQRLVIARALIGRPEVLLLDEPLRAVDVVGRTQLMATLRALMADGTLGAVLFSSHDLDAPETIGTRTLLLSGGRLAFDGTPGPGEIRARIESERPA